MRPARPTSPLSSHPNMTKFLLLAGVCAVLLLPGCTSVPTTNAEVNAQTVNKYEKWSSSGDGRISFADFNKNLSADRFAYYDTNKDGFIEKSEWVTVRGSGADANKLFAQVNASHTGKITPAEFTNNKMLVANRKATFNTLDKGHKGYLNSKDIVAYFATRSAI
jgi:Ca2+-binding EF-hand superfamily protein